MKLLPSIGFMRKSLLLLSLGLMLSSVTIAGSSKNESPDEDLVFSHENYKLENFSFISKNFSIGLVNSPFQKQTLVILYNHENLIVDSIFTDWKVEKIIPEDDSSFYLLSDNQTINCLIRNDELLINGMYAGNNSNTAYEKLAYYSLPLNRGEFQIVKSSGTKKEFALQLSKQDNSLIYYPFSQRKKQIDIDLFATQNDIFVYLPDKQKLIQVDKEKRLFDEIILSRDGGSWLFYHDYIENQSYLLNKYKSERKLYTLNGNRELDFIKDLDFVPEAIFNGSLHKKTEKGKNYSHYLIPLKAKDKEKTIHLKGVTISSE
ncbi:MAG: hypothetical protein RIA99_04930 [Cytophagales bacterium]